MYAFKGWDLDDIQLQKPSGRHLFWGQLMNIHCDAADPRYPDPPCLPSSRSTVSEHQDQSANKRVLVAVIRQYAFIASLKHAPNNIISI